MAKAPEEPLRKFELNKQGDKWKLEPEGGGRARAVFDRKGDALKGGVMADALGQQGGSVKIRKETGAYQSERTYPRGRDPKGSKG